MRNSIGTGSYASVTKGMFLGVSLHSSSRGVLVRIKSMTIAYQCKHATYVYVN